MTARSVVDKIKLGQQVTVIYSAPYNGSIVAEANRRGVQIQISSVFGSKKITYSFADKNYRPL